MLFGWYKLVVGIREQKCVHHVSPSLSYGRLPGHHPTSPISPISVVPSSDSSTTRPEPPLTARSELAREKMWSRIHLIPLLQAEEDRDQIRRHLADQAREKELLGENFKVYHSDR
jgi:hypothetical protein